MLITKALCLIMITLKMALALKNNRKLRKRSKTNKKRCKPQQNRQTISYKANQKLSRQMRPSEQKKRIKHNLPQRIKLLLKSQENNQNQKRIKRRKSWYNQLKMKMRKLSSRRTRRKKSRKLVKSQNKRMKWQRKNRRMNKRPIFTVTQTRTIKQLTNRPMTQSQIVKLLLKSLQRSRIL